VIDALGNPDRLAKIFTAYYHVRPKRPAFTTSVRLKHAVKSITCLTTARPLRGILTLFAEIAVTVIGFFGWFVFAAIVVGALIGIVGVYTTLEFSVPFEKMLTFVYIGLLFFSYPIARLSGKVSFFAAGLLWSISRASASASLARTFGEDR
jgi:hypothetical protein